jgi:Putative esterase
LKTPLIRLALMAVALAVSLPVTFLARKGQRPSPETSKIDRPSISEAVKDQHGVLVHTVRSRYQSGETAIRVLVSDQKKPGVRLPVVYVLPVEPRNESRYGDGLLEVRRHGLHDKFQAIFVAPTFSHLPWYADHPTDPQIRQESYFLEVVMPFVESRYPASPEPSDRLLLGFSKSGWGAFSLLLRHPDVFGKAAAWDAPLVMDRPGKYGSGDVFGTTENFENYRITVLLRRRAADLGEDVRLIHLGYGNFRDEHEAFEAIFNKHRVPHRYKDGPRREHRWESGWLPEAVGMLLGGEEKLR